MEIRPHNPGGWVSGKGESGGELLIKICFYFYAAGEGLEEKVMD